MIILIRNNLAGLEIRNTYSSLQRTYYQADKYNPEIDKKAQSKIPKEKTLAKIDKRKFAIVIRYFP